MRYLPIPPFLLLLLVALPAMSQTDMPPEHCDCPTVRLDDAYCAADLVFEGVPFKTDTLMAPGGGTPDAPVMGHVVVQFKAGRVLKGKTDGAVMILTTLGPEACTFRFLKGTSYLVFAHAENGTLRTDRCTPTRAMDDVRPAFQDSLEFVRSGQQWEGRVPLDKPCR
jgi:hypothetical protein